MNDVKLRLDYLNALKIKLVVGDGYKEGGICATIETKSEAWLLNDYDIDECEDIIITSFAPRKNYGAQPVGDGVPVIVFNLEENDNTGMAQSMNWHDLKDSFINIATWKPDLDALIKMQIQHDELNNSNAEWRNGDECIIVNDCDYELCDISSELLGEKSKFISQFKNSNGIDLAVVEHKTGSCFCYRIEMLSKPETQEQKAERELDAAKEKQVNELIDFIREHGNHTDITGMAKLMQKRGMLAEILLPLEK